MATNSSRFLELFEKTQWLPAEVLHSHQQQGLEKMLRHAAAETEAYPARLEPVFRDGRIDMSAWNEVPFLTRKEAQLEPEALHARHIPPNTGGVTKNSTSGSTARTLEHLCSGLTLWVSSALTIRGQRWFGTDFSQTLAIIQSYKDNPKANSPEGLVSTGEWAAGTPPGTIARMGILTATTIQNNWLEKIRPDYLLTYPSQAVGLVDTLRDHQWPQNIRLIFSAGEALTPDQRQRVAEKTNIRMVDGYGTSELGVLAFECPVSGMMHLTAENAFIEVVRDDGSPVSPGETGEIVATSLTNFAMPFIRYRFGDFAETVSTPCPCGRSLPVVKRVVGRMRNMFRRPDGALIWPSIPSGELARRLPNRQFQLIQKTKNIVELKFVPLRDDQEIDRQTVTQYFRQRLFPELDLRITPVPEIKRGPGGKFEDCIREIA